jgi:hypothetical protein
MPPHLLSHSSKVASVLAAHRPSSHLAHVPDNLLEFWRRRPAQTKSGCSRAGRRNYKLFAHLSLHLHQGLRAPHAHLFLVGFQALD